MSWAPVAGAGGGYLLGNLAGASAQQQTGVPLLGVAGGVGGAYLAWRYATAHPAAGLPILAVGAGATAVYMVAATLVAWAKLKKESS